MSPHGHAASGAAGIAWLTISDTRREETDASAAAARRRIEAAGHRVADYAIVPDEPAAVRQRVTAWLARGECELVITSGGTGFAARDRTFEALAELLERRLDGFGELFRMLSFEQVGSAAMLSRAFGGIAGGKPLFCLPGAQAAVELALERLILPELGHLLAELRKR
ncbi:MAG TPA: MogA/MoaB family molybdenum cofactor biosynthesis protein [Candidatus Polarisedimenticolaceae bacterium]|nr:MogA/MoaB family molybdenum cofactor biosynthesis protein [Candidatus Polarisedimenticolaceae bacterium]